MGASTYFMLDMLYDLQEDSDEADQMWRFAEARRLLPPPPKKKKLSKKKRMKLAAAAAVAVVAEPAAVLQ